MWNIKALAFTVQKLLARLKFQREWQNDRMMEWRNDRQDKNNMPPDLQSRGALKSNYFNIFNCIPEKVSPYHTGSMSTQHYYGCQVSIFLKKYFMTKLFPFCSNKKDTVKYVVKCWVNVCMGLSVDNGGCCQVKSSRLMFSFEMYLLWEGGV